MLFQVGKTLKATLLSEVKFQKSILTGALYFLFAQAIKH